MKLQNNLTSKNSSDNLNHEMNDSNTGIHYKSQTEDNFHDNNYLKGFNDHVIEEFINNKMQNER